MTPEFILAIVATAISAAGLGFTAAQLWAALVPLRTQRKREVFLNEQLSRGPYDKGTIEQSTRYYINPKCSNIDPAQEQELRHALVATQEKLFDKVDYFLDQESS